MLVSKVRTYLKDIALKVDRLALDALIPIEAIKTCL